jgi:hypothetical protein
MRNLATWAAQEAFSSIWQQVTSICLKSKNHLRKNANETKSELKCSKKFWNFFSIFVQIFTPTKWLKGDDGGIYHLMQLWKNNLWVLLWVQYHVRFDKEYGDVPWYWMHLMFQCTCHLFGSAKTCSKYTIELSIK